MINILCALHYSRRKQLCWYRIIFLPLPPHFIILAWLQCAPLLEKRTVRTRLQCTVHQNEQFACGRARFSRCWELQYRITARITVQVSGNCIWSTLQCKYLKNYSALANSNRIRPVLRCTVCIWISYSIHLSVATVFGQDYSISIWKIAVHLSEATVFGQDYCTV